MIKTIRNASLRRLVPPSAPQPKSEATENQPSDVLSKTLLNRLHRTADSITIRSLDSAVADQKALGVEVAGAALTGSAGAALRLVNSGKGLVATHISSDGKETPLPVRERPELTADSARCMDVTHLPNGDRLFVSGLYDGRLGITRTRGSDQLACYYDVHGESAELSQITVSQRTEAGQSRASLSSSDGVLGSDFSRTESLPGDTSLTRSLRRDGSLDTRLTGRFEDVWKFGEPQTNIPTTGASKLQEDPETVRTVLSDAAAKLETESGILLP